MLLKFVTLSEHIPEVYPCSQLWMWVVRF